jgi:uncharacterized RDD family membrane protein YckC
MDIWLIRDGEKTGPFHDFEIRRKIEAGELPGTTPAWHEGLDAWKPLVDIDLFTREFERPETPPEEVAVDKQVPPPLPVKPHCLRRFWARWLDLSLYSGFWWLGMWAAGQDFEAVLSNLWLLLSRFVPWFALEALLIHRFRTTPGKWLLGLEVVNADGSRLTLAAATRRSLHVLVAGIGLGWDLLAVFCQTLCLITALRIKTTQWDYAGGFQVKAKPMKPLRILVLVILFAGAMYLRFILFYPYTVKMTTDMFPALKEQYDKNPPWHLPKRS